MSQYTLLTGATGLVGGFLMRDLLAAGQRLAVVIRGTDRAEAAARVDRLLAGWENQAGRRLPRPVCFVGDVNRPRLGLDPPDLRWIARHCQRVIHNAAVLQFLGGDRRQEPWRTNVEGTRSLVQFCQEIRLGEFHYVSTAYVCGKQTGTVSEAQRIVGQEFRNDYEQSKHRAEELIRDCNRFASATIYRPVAIAGDSQTGFSTNFHGVYVYLRLLDLLLKQTPCDDGGRRRAPMRIALTGDERRNLVPVDWVSQVICELVTNPAAHGRTFHLAPQTPITARIFFDLAYRLFNCDGVEFLGPDWQFDGEVSPLEQAFLTHGSLYRDYERTDPVFDTANLQQFAGHIPCPPITYELLKKYLAFGRATAWGKRPPLLATGPHLRREAA